MENFLRGYDKLSGNINLKYKGLDGYRNWFAGLLTFMIHILTFAVSIYFFRNMFLRIDPKSYTVKKYVERGVAKFDQNHLFHFFALVDSKTSKPIIVDKDLITIESFTMFVTNKKIIKYMYDSCRYEDFYGIENLIVPDFDKFYCLRNMIDLRNPTNDTDNVISNLKSLSKPNNYEEIVNEQDVNNPLNPKFIYPWMTIEKSDSVQNIIYYQINIKKCTNGTYNNFNCKSEEEINKRVDTLFFNLKFIDNMFDVGNYSWPITKYINNKNGVLKKDSQVNIYLNFFAVNIITRDGLIFDSSKNIETYAFDFHSESFSPIKSNLVHQTQFYILNNAQNYERSYTRLQNVAADIGGIFKFFTVIGSVLNFLLERYYNFNINNNLLDILKIRTDIGDTRSYMQSVYITNNINKKNFKLSNIEIIKKNEKENIYELQNIKQVKPIRRNLNTDYCVSHKSNQIKNGESEKKEIKLAELNNSQNLKNALNINKKNNNQENSVINNPNKKTSKNKRSIIQSLNNNQSSMNNLNCSYNLNIIHSNKMIDEKDDYNKNNTDRKNDPLNSLFNHNDTLILKRDLLVHNVKGFCNYLFNLVICKLSPKINFTEKLRNILLDELNIYILHLEVAKIKKIIKEEIKFKQSLNNYEINLNDLIEYYIVWS